MQYANAVSAAASGGIVGYVFALGALFPAALLSGVAAYRLKNLVRHGIPAYTAGCSPVNLVAALALAALGSVAAIALVSVASSLTIVSATAPFFTGTTGLTTAGLPGPVAGGLAAALSSLGAVLLGVALSSLHAAPGFGTSACRMGTSRTPVLRAWSPNPVAARGPDAAPVEEPLPLPLPSKPLPSKPPTPGWQQHGLDEKGDVCAAPEGATVWDPPQAESAEPASLKV
jgi:hypothetical protein